METIEVRYTLLGQIGGQNYYHKYIVYTDSFGNQFAARGGPGDSPDGNQLDALTAAQGGTATSEDSPLISGVR